RDDIHGDAVRPELPHDGACEATNSRLGRAVERGRGHELSTTPPSRRGTHADDASIALFLHRTRYRIDTQDDRGEIAREDLVHLVPGDVADQRLRPNPDAV